MLNYGEYFEYVIEILIRCYPEKKKLHNVLGGKIIQSKYQQKGRGHVRTVLVLEKTRR